MFLFFIDIIDVWIQNEVDALVNQGHSVNDVIYDISRGYDMK
jgi:hypothetical protein